MSILSSQLIKEFIYSRGVDLCGIASADKFEGAPKGAHPNDILQDANSVVVFAKRFLRGTVQATSTIPYTIVRNQLSTDIDRLSMEFSYFIEKYNYIALPTGSVGPTNWDNEANRCRGLLSLKHAAELAGLGRIGKNTLLVNKDFGNMIWLGAVVTNAKLTPDPYIETNYCIEGCTLCIDNCPVKALSTTPPYVSQIKCWDFAYGKEKGEEFRINCYKCRSICPLSLGV